MHNNNITWLQRTGSSTEIFYFLNWAVHIIVHDSFHAWDDGGMDHHHAVDAAGGSLSGCVDFHFP